MEKLKKILLISSLVSLGLTCVLFILAIFEFKIFEGVWLNILLIFASLCVGCGFLANEINILKRNRILGILSISFLVISMVFALIIFCSSLLEKGGTFNTITAIIALFSTFFMIIVSLVTKLEKKLLALQILSYIILLVLEIFLSIIIAGYPLFNVNAMTEVFSVFCVVSVGLLVALWILSSKRNSTETVIHNNNEYISILKEDYDNLIKENEKLKNQIKEMSKSKWLSYIIRN